MVLAAGATDPAPLISFSVIMLIAFIAPLFSHLSGNRIPSVVLLIAGGVLIGPHALDWANTDGGVGLLKELGLGMLFLLAGYEIDPAMLKTKQAKHGVSTWLICACVSYIGAVLLLGSMRSLAAVALAIAVTSTAIGTLMPILKSSQLLGTPVGKSVLVHGAIGEVMPIIAMVLLLSARATWLTAVVLFAFVAIAVLIALVPRTVAFLLPWAERAMIDSAGSTNQTIVRGVLVILAVLMAVAAAFQLDVVLGAFAAGFILRQLLPEEFRISMEHRLDIVGYSLFIPVFFVCSGMGIDPQAVADRPFMLVVLVPLIFMTRGLPIILREKFFDTGSGIQGWKERWQVGLYAATALPIIVAVTEVASSSGIISTENASLMVAAGSVTVLLFPMIAASLGKTSKEALKS